MKNMFAIGAGLFLAGAAIGGAVAALTTPLTGRRARRMIRREIERGSRELGRSTRQVRDRIANVAAIAR